MDGLCTLLVTGAPLTSRAADIARALVEDGWRVQVVATPSSLPWVDARAVEAVTGAPPRSEHRSPGTPRTSGRPDLVVIAPATMNTISKLAVGILDTYAHAVACEALAAGVPMLVVPMVNDRLWKHPAFDGHLRTLSGAGALILDIRTGGPDPGPIPSGQGNAVVEAFDPDWIRQAARPARKS
ncbi:MAG: hypothetical protein QG608_1418 [Actinomycetota bacterium]|nr:hypothetical protein [Actinomycetota bacterium]